MPPVLLIVVAPATLDAPTIKGAAVLTSCTGVVALLPPPLRDTVPIVLAAVRTMVGAVKVPLVRFRAPPVIVLPEVTMRAGFRVASAARFTLPVALIVALVAATMPASVDRKS